MAVIGGGPAGASAAREAAQRGLSVLLFDYAHPRRKGNRVDGCPRKLNRM